MKILVISDTHYSEEEIDQNLYDLIKESDFLIHAGDFSSLKSCERFEKACFENKIPFKAVYGNCDPAEVRHKFPEKNTFEIEGIKFGLVHKAGRSLQENTARWYLLKEMQADVLIFGHIHTPVLDVHEGKYIICPGSPTLPRMSDPAAIRITAERGKIKNIDLINLGLSMCPYIQFRRNLQKERKE